MDIIKMARDLGSAIQETSEYKALEAAKNENDKDAVLGDLIGKFNLKRIDLNNEMNKVDRDKEKMKQLDTEIREIYDMIMKNEHMAAYNVAKQAVDALMNQINMVLVMAVNGEDPQTCDVTPSSCSGGCDSCSGCC